MDVLDYTEAKNVKHKLYTSVQCVWIFKALLSQLDTYRSAVDSIWF